MTDDDMHARLQVAGQRWRTATAPAVLIERPFVRRRHHRALLMASIAAVAAALLVAAVAVVRDVGDVPTAASSGHIDSLLLGRWNLTSIRAIDAGPPRHGNYDGSRLGEISISFTRDRWVARYECGLVEFGTWEGHGDTLDMTKTASTRPHCSPSGLFAQLGPARLPSGALEGSVSWHLDGPWLDLTRRLDTETFHRS